MRRKLHLKMPSNFLRNMQGLVALGLIVAGVAFWSVPAALVTAGVLLLLDRVT